MQWIDIQGPPQKITSEHGTRASMVVQGPRFWPPDPLECWEGSSCISRSSTARTDQCRGSPVSGRASCRLGEKQDSQKTPAKVEQKTQVRAKQTTFPGASVPLKANLNIDFVKDNFKYGLRNTGLYWVYILSTYCQYLSVYTIFWNKKSMF